MEKRLLVSDILIIVITIVITVWIAAITSTNIINKHTTKVCSPVAETKSLGEQNEN